jgi:HEAT repeat protein
MPRAWILPAALAAMTGACATAPPPAPPVVSFEQKMSWMLRLEDTRTLRDPSPPAPAPAAGRGRNVVQMLPPSLPDLGRLVADPEARVRRRAALAIGRVGLAEGVPLLVPRLSDPEPEVRQMAAFALGLLGDRSAVEPLRAALKDTSPLVQGRAAEALGLIGDTASAPPIADLVAGCVRNGSLARIAADESVYPLDAPVEAFRLGVFALARLKAYDPLARAVLDPSGQPIVRWWPVAYALSQVDDRRALPALLTFARAEGSIARGFSVRGLGALKEPSAIDVLLPMAQAWRANPGLAAAAVRALGQIGDPRAAPVLLKLLDVPGLDSNVRLEVVGAVGAMRVAAAVDPLLDLLADPWPSMRAAAMRALGDIDPQNFLIALSGLDPDRHWSVRAALASVVATLDPSIAVPRLTLMLGDQDQRVIPSVLNGLVKLRAPGTEALLAARLNADDEVVRMTAAAGLGELKPANGGALLADAYQRWQVDASYVARAAALAALAKHGVQAAVPVLQKALGDKDWAVRVRAAALLNGLDPGVAVAGAMRPAPGRAAADYGVPGLVAPPVSPHAYIDTDKGTIEIELAVLDAPLTCDSFVALARKGYFNGLAIHRVVPNFVMQAGDPRGDGEGGPGYTIRDEMNERPYLRGTVGMALDWADTGGSQFFITVTPQPRLDARYTVFGSVVSGMDVVDRLQQWDVIRRVRIWDGTRRKP